MDPLRVQEQNLLAIRHRFLVLEDDLNALKIQHIALAHETEKLVANIAAKRVQNSPIRDLVPELCDIIFAYCAEAECSLDCNNVPDSNFEKLYPLSLANVCRRWRAMVMDNPSLWTTLHLRPSTSPDSEVQRLHLFISRSMDMPLNITICPSHKLRQEWDTRAVSSAVRPLLVQLFPHFYRIRSFKTHLGMEILPIMFPKEFTTEMSLIENLELFVDDHRVSTPSLGLLDSPRLRNLHVRDVTPLVEALSGTMHLLHSLTITGCDQWKCSRAFPKMLSRCTDLRSCSITFPNNLFFMDVEPIVLPELESLSLEWPFLFEPSPIFRALRAPKLRSLRIAHLSRQLVLPLQILSSLKGLVQSAPLLSRLTLSGCNLLYQDEYVALLQEAHNVRELELINCQHFLLPLSPTDPFDASTWLCPVLERLKITGLHDSDVRPIVNLARNRALGYTNAEKIKAATPDTIKYGFLSELEVDTRSRNLTRQGRLLILSGLFSMQLFLDIKGPYGNLFRTA